MSNVVKFLIVAHITLDVKIETMCWALGLVSLLVAKVVSSADAVMFPHCGWELDDGTWGEKVGRWLLPPWLPVRASGPQP